LTTQIINGSHIGIPKERWIQYNHDKFSNRLSLNGQWLDEDSRRRRPIDVEQTQRRAGWLSDRWEWEMTLHNGTDRVFDATFRYYESALRHQKQKPAAHIEFTLSCLEIIEYNDTNGIDGYQEGQDTLLQPFSKIHAPLQWNRPDAQQLERCNEAPYHQFWLPEEVLPEDRIFNELPTPEEMGENMHCVGASAWNRTEFRERDKVAWKFSAEGSSGLSPLFPTRIRMDVMASQTSESININTDPRKKMPLIQLDPNSIELTFDVEYFPFSDPTFQSEMAWKMKLSSFHHLQLGNGNTEGDTIAMRSFKILDDRDRPAQPDQGYSVDLKYGWDNLPDARLPEQATFGVPHDINVRVHTSSMQTSYETNPKSSMVMNRRKHNNEQSRFSNDKIHGKQSISSQSRFSNNDEQQSISSQQQSLLSEKHHMGPNVAKINTFWWSFLSPAPYRRISWDPKFTLDYHSMNIHHDIPEIESDDDDNLDLILGLSLGLGLGLLLVLLILFLIYRYMTSSFSSRKFLGTADTSHAQDQQNLEREEFY